MKLDEITLIPSINDHGIDLGLFDEETKHKIGTLLDFDVYLCKASNDPNVFLISAEIDNKKISMITVLIGYVFKDTEYVISKRLWTEPSYRGKGLASQLIVLTRKYFGKRVMSDVGQTPEGKKVWDSLRKRYSVSALDINSGERIPADTVPDNEIYKVNKSDPENKFLLVLEGELGPLEKAFKGYAISYKILRPYPVL